MNNLGKYMSVEGSQKATQVGDYVLHTFIQSHGKAFAAYFYSSGQ